MCGSSVRMSRNDSIGFDERRDHPMRDLARCEDGFVTRSGTFQKYYQQQELRTWIDETLAVASVPVAPGVFYIFRDVEIRESFLASRQRRRTTGPRLQDRSGASTQPLPADTGFSNRGFARWLESPSALHQSAPLLPGFFSSSLSRRKRTYSCAIPRNAGRLIRAGGDSSICGRLSECRCVS